MRKVIYSMMVSLDGFIEGPNHEIDWILIDEELHQFANNQQSEIDIYLHGRRMYEIMNAYWPTADKDTLAPGYIIEFARIWQNMPKIVFSKTLAKVEGKSRLVKDNIAVEIARLKAQPGKNLALGGAAIASTCIQLGLVDEYRLFVQPVILGSGAPMFPAWHDKINLRLVETRAFGSGVVYLRYQRADEEL